MGRFTENFRNSRRLKVMSEKNGMTNSMFIHQGVSEMNELIKKHPEVQKVLDLITDQYGYFDASLDHNKDSVIIHCSFPHYKEGLHIVMDLPKKKLFVLDDLNWNRVTK
ncbi:MAG TPA: hypothetical protein PK122_06905 [Candidatus Paceibacterota bacterium]|nr:hypothetical protein [Candidatus Paceibacterota bacterium]